MRTLLSLIFIVITSAVFSQESSPRPVYDNFRLTIRGKVVDTSNNKPLEGAVVQLTSVPNTPDYATDRFFSKTIIADKNGNFEFNNVPFAINYNLVVSVIGYSSYTRTLQFNAPREDENKNLVRELDPVALVQEAHSLADVVVTAVTNPPMQFNIDRKVYNVEKNITAQGGTAVDVMKNIPSLSVDVNGNVQMRNSSPQILVDGRPTILTLDQIAADDIQSIELITNPSAKFDASSAGGIINIVLKKNKRVGFNGMASAGAGTPGVLNGNLSLNLRQNKINLFATGNYNRSGGNTTGETYRENKMDGKTTDYFTQHSDNSRSRKFNSVRFGADYFIDSKTTLSFTQGFVSGRFGSDETQDQKFFDSSFTLNHTGIRTSNGTGSFDRSNSRLSFDRSFNRSDNKLTADISYNKGKRSNASLIYNDYFNLDGSAYQPQSVVRNDGSGTDNQFTFQVDYSNKINENRRIEAGLRSYYSGTSTKFSTFSIGDGVETKLPLSNDYKYNESINAGYFNYADTWKDIQFQVGLRMEFSKLDGELVDSNFTFGYKYPKDLKHLFDATFPSIFLTKKLDDHQDIQLNYSKRIRRPRFWEVNPFIDINDPLNINKGNPGLAPELTNSFEFNYSNQFQSGSFLGVLYFKNNVGDITDYSDTITTDLYNQLINAGVSPNAIINTYINAGYTNRWGAEFTIQKKLFKNFDFVYNIDLQHRKTSARINDLNLSNSGFNWETKLILNYKTGDESSAFFKNLSFQWMADFESPRVIPQGREKSRFVSDFAMRKEFLKDKAASLSLSVNDIFNTRRYGTIYDTESFYQDSYRRWSVRTFRITFSYKFGDNRLDLFKRRNSGNNMGGEGEFGG